MVLIVFSVILVVIFPYSLASELRDEIADIRKILQYQNERILLLERENLALKSRFSHSEEDNVVLREQVVGVVEKNRLLQNQVVDLQKQISMMKEFLERIKPQNVDLQGPQNKSPTMNIKNRRLLALVTDPPPAPVEPVAFYAFMSNPEPDPNNHRTLIFDVVKTNLGNGYNKNSGTFVAPSAGAYVFTWTINANPHGTHLISLMVNNAIAGGSLTITRDTNDYDSDSNTAVVVLNHGDSVNLRATSASDRVEIYVDVHVFNTFNGWRL